MYLSDLGCQIVIKVSIHGSSCVPFGWYGRYTGPGRFKFALPTSDRVLVFTDHSALIFRKDGTRCESIILDEDEDATDAGMWRDTVLISVAKTVREF